MIAEFVLSGIFAGFAILYLIYAMAYPEQF